MKKKKIFFKYKGKKINLEVSRVPWWYEGIGLMFSKKKKAEALLFSFRKPTRMAIFSLFIPFEFLAVWLDKENKVIEIKVVKRGEINVSPSRKFVKLVEIPVIKKYDGIIKLLVED